MHAKEMLTRNIQAHIKNLYNYEITVETVSSITERVIDKAREWQSRPLELIYAVIYMDAVFLKMRTEDHVWECGSGDWLLRNRLTETQTNDILEIFEDRYNHGSVMVVAQIPVGAWR